MKGKVQLLALLAIFLAFSFFFYLSIAQEAMNSSLNLTTNENSSEQSASTNLVSEDSNSQQSVDLLNTTSSELTQMNESNSTEENETSENISTPATQISQTTEIIARPKISLRLSTDKSRITRGESFLLRVVVSNEGSANATNVRVSVDLPKGFYTDALEKICNVIEVNSYCELEFSVKSDLSTKLGESEIKVRVAYE
ncbi:MAG: NEW3 domain-containing protein [Candidatus Aenigmarchaeota archaeon]|nr:NEW3 domain-containing protein [Candidatus Aenigmarchaeota archaeon]